MKPQGYFLDKLEEEPLCEETISQAPSLSSPKPSITEHGRDKRVALIREEFVDLTNDPLLAIVLNQLFYWSKRVKDYDLMVEEEKKPRSPHTSPQYGWFYKSAQELNEETMICVSNVTIRRYLGFFVDQGWIEERANPQNKWDRTTQYRVSYQQLEIDLRTVGHSLPGFPKDEFLTHASKCSLDASFCEKRQISRCFNLKHRESIGVHFESRLVKHRESIGEGSLYLTKTTSETTNKEHTHCARNNPQMMIELWMKHVDQESLHLTLQRENQLEVLLDLYFQKDLSQWEEFCKRVKASPFLMGGGPSKWHVSLDWVLLKNNFLKVLEGNFDDPEEIKRKKIEKERLIREEKTKEVLDSIEDPFWREWCGRLCEFPPHGYSKISNALYHWEIERIKDARFVEFDGRHVIIGSSTQKVINKIENHRFQLTSIAQKNFPTARSIGTRLLEEERVLEGFSSSFRNKTASLSLTDPSADSSTDSLTNNPTSSSGARPNPPFASLAEAWSKFKSKGENHE